MHKSNFIIAEIAIEQILSVNSCLFWSRNYQISSAEENFFRNKSNGKVITTGIKVYYSIQIPHSRPYGASFGTEHESIRTTVSARKPVTVQDVNATVTNQYIVAIAAYDCIISLATPKKITSVVPLYLIVITIAVNGVIACSRANSVPSLAAIESIRPLITPEIVVPGISMDIIGTGATG